MTKETISMNLSIWDSVMNYQGAIDHILKRLEKELSPDLKYHAVIHTVSIIRNCRKIAQAEGVEGIDLQLLITAAAYHDSGFLECYDRNEALGCKIAQQALTEYDFTKEQINRICGMIMATQPPQSPNNKLEMILCDADLFYLGGDQYEDIAESLFEELQLHGKDMSSREWLEMQVHSLQEHQYFTQFAKTTRGPRKQEILARLRTSLDQPRRRQA